MAVAEMGKLNLAGMSYEKDALLNALQRTGATEIKLHYEADNTVALSADCENLREYLTNVQTALDRLCGATENYNKENKVKSDVLKDGFEVSYTQFMSAKEMKEDIDALVEKINSLYDENKGLNAELAKLRRTIDTARIYSSVTRPLALENTPHTKFKLGTVPAAVKENLIIGLEEIQLAVYSLFDNNAENCLLFVCAHNSVAEQVEGVLQNAGFSNCPFTDGATGEELYKSLKRRETEISGQLQRVSNEIYSFNGRIHDLKIYCDYLGFELEKQQLSDKMRATQTTFLLEAYVPKEAEEQVKQAISGVTEATYFEFSAPADDEVPPTLLKNNKVVKNFEAITNMYSPVSYKEFDPNTVMAFFYSVFLGFIMGDIGYGLLMILSGGFVYFKIKRESTMKSLAGIFAIGGIFAVIWGFLFNSLFGIQLPMHTVIPDAQKEMWLLMGIKIPSVLIISLLIGMVQLCAGYVCKAVQCFRRGQVWDGLLDGIVWALFTVGVALALIGLVEEFNATPLAYAGGITAGATLLIAILTAGRKEKLLGKFTKGFGAAYGVINFASDVLSYARLYGLMLSGAVIAQIISGYAVTGMNGGVGMLFSGNAGLIILGVVLLIVGHVFNLAIGLLGAYIHDARLQYVEFYGRFYEGEGELFAPLGSQHKYIYLK